MTRSNACIKFHCDYRIYIKIVLSNFLEFLFVLCFKAENKSNKQYFERALSKSLTKFGHTTLKEQQKSCIRKLVVDSQDVFAVLPTGFGKSLIYQVLPTLFSELHRLCHGTVKNFVVAVVIPLEFIRVQQVERTKLFASVRLNRETELLKVP